MVKTKLKYVIPTFFTCFVQILTARTEEILVGLDRIHESLWPRNRVQKWGPPVQHRVLPASKLIVVPCTTSCSLSTCSIAMVTARVTHTVIWAFHAHLTFPRCN